MYLSTMYLSTLYLNTKRFANQVYYARDYKSEIHRGGPFISQPKNPAQEPNTTNRAIDPSARVVGHHLVGEKLDGPHGLLVGQVTPLEGRDEVVGPGGRVLVEVIPDRLR